MYKRQLQKSVGATEDGAIGPATLALVSNHGVENLIEDVSRQRQLFYENLKTFDTFGRGWTRRNEETKRASLEMMD